MSMVQVGEFCRCFPFDTQRALRKCTVVVNLPVPRIQRSVLRAVIFARRVPVGS